MTERSNGDSYTTDYFPYKQYSLNGPTLSKVAEGMCIQYLLFNSLNTSYLMHVLCDNSSAKWNATAVPTTDRHS